MRGWTLAVAVAGLASASSAAAAAPVTVAVSPERPAPEEAHWYEVRAARVLGHQLTLLGGWVADVAPADALTAVVAVRPQEVERSQADVSVSVALRQGKRTHRLEAKGKAEDLDRLAARLARETLVFAGAPPPESAAALLPVTRLPFAVHRFLGRAEVRLRRGDVRQAALMYGRAQELVSGLWVPEAFSGRHAAEAALVAEGQQEPGAKRELAASAAERALVAVKNGRGDVALESLASFLRYTPDQALRWAWRAPVGAAPVVTRRTPWLVAAGAAHFDLDPRTGVARAVGAQPGLVVGTVQDDWLVLKGRDLVRQMPSGERRWSLRLPSAPGPGGTVLTSGLFGVLGEDSVAWIDASIGSLGQVARPVVPLACGAGGALALIPGADAGAGVEVALLRPGKKTPAWQTPVVGARDTALTRDRVVLVAEAGLVLLRSHDGKPLRAPLEIPAGARLLGAEGRYAALADPEGRVVIVDILAGERTATVQGPGRPVAADTTGQGVVLLFEGGDVLFLDRDGRMVERAWVPGAPQALLQGNPVTPGPVVVTGAGLFALADVDPQAGLQRDVDAELMVAELLAARGETTAALGVVTGVAQRGAGRVGAAELLRAQLLEKLGGPGTAEAAAAARARGARAADPRQGLGPFVLAPDGAE
jgi:hypothetical protein